MHVQNSNSNSFIYLYYRLQYTLNDACAYGMRNYNVLVFMDQMYMSHASRDAVRVLERPYESISPHGIQVFPHN